MFRTVKSTLLALSVVGLCAPTAFAESPTPAGAEVNGALKTGHKKAKHMLNKGKSLGPQHGKAGRAQRKAMKEVRKEIRADRKAQRADGKELRGQAKAHRAEAKELRAQGKGLKAEGKALKAEGKALKAKGKAMRAEGRALGADGKAMRAEGRALRVEGKGLKAKGKALTAEGRALKVDARGLKAEGRALKGKGKALKAERVDTRAKAKAVKGATRAAALTGSAKRLARENRKHAQRIAKIERLEALARGGSVADMSAKIADLRTKETARHKAALARIEKNGDLK